jgi:hypothetical protein
MPHGTVLATRHGMTHPTNPGIARHLSATIALERTSIRTERTARRSSTTLCAVDPRVAAKMSWVRAVLQSALK